MTKLPEPPARPTTSRSDNPPWAEARLGLPAFRLEPTQGRTTGMTLYCRFGARSHAARGTGLPEGSSF